MAEAILATAGGLGVLIALMHGVLSQRRLLPAITGLSRTQGRINAAVYHLSTLYWAAGGGALVWAALRADAAGQSLLGLAVGFLYAGGAAANIWATRGRHFGGRLLAVAAALAIAGAIAAAE